MGIGMAMLPMKDKTHKSIEKLLISGVNDVLDVSMTTIMTKT